ncbi:MAG: hypothetical protein U1F43_25165 [Myxococcota bacterium]
MAVVVVAVVSPVLVVASLESALVAVVASLRTLPPVSPPHADEDCRR